MDSVKYTLNDNIMITPKISQSLIKEALKPNHCPKQIMYSFIEGKELLKPTETMELGRYFESEVLGACRGGEIQEAKLKKDGKPLKKYSDTAELVEFAKDVLEKIGLDISKGQSQFEAKTELLIAHYDHLNKDLESDKEAIFDLKWTATKENDVWNGWGDFDTMTEEHIQACHYVLTEYERTGIWKPFYFLVFGKEKWFKLIKVEITPEAMEIHKQRIAQTTSIIRYYAENKYKGNGSFNKCVNCPFYSDCEDRNDNPKNIEVFKI